MKLGRLARYPAFALLAVAVLLIGSWCSGAIWYRCGCEGAIRMLLAGAAGFFSVVAALCLATWWRWPVMAVYWLAVGALLLWWTAILPAGSREWAPDVTQNATAAFDGDRVVVSNVRNFTWRSETDFDPVWEERSYALSHASGVDLIMSYRMGEAIAHTIVSFGFDDGNRLAFSIRSFENFQKIMTMLCEPIPIQIFQQRSENGFPHRCDATTSRLAEFLAIAPTWARGVGASSIPTGNGLVLPVTRP